MMMNTEGSTPEGIKNVLGLLALYQVLIDENSEYYAQEGIK